MSRLLTRIAQAYWVVVFPLLLVLIAARLVMTPVFLQFEYNRPDFPPDPYGFTREDRLTYAPYAVDYLINGADITYLEDLKFSDGSRLYAADELRHMRDVKALTQAAFAAAVIAGLLAVADAVLLARRNALNGALSTGALVTLALVAAIIIGAVVNWEGFFVAFHEMFFQNGTWYFPTSDTLIRLFPEQFWFDAALTIGGITVVTSFALLFVTARLRRL